MQTKRYIFPALAALTLLTVVPCQAAITWTGGSDLNFWNSLNWAGGIGPVSGGTTNDNIIVSTSALTLVAGASNLTLADGFSMTVTNTRLDFLSGGTRLIQGITGGTANNINLNTNASIRASTIATGITVTVASGSQLSLSGVNRAINSSVEISTVNLAPGTLIVFESGSNDPALALSGIDRGNGWSIINSFTGTSFSTDQLTAPLTDFFVLGFDSSPFRVTSGGDGLNGGLFSINAIPEPSAALLGGLGILCLLRRRRI